MAELFTSEFILSEFIRRESVYLWYYFDIQFRQIAGYWVAGMALGSLISVFGKEKIHGLFAAMQGKKLGWAGVIPASLIGVASPLCMYGTIPIAASFSEKGMEDDWLAAFMMSSILLNPQLLFYSAALGVPALAIRFVSCFLCGVVAGLCARCLCKGKKFFNFSGFRERASHDTDANVFLRFLKNFGRNIRANSVMPPDVAGSGVLCADDPHRAAPLPSLSGAEKVCRGYRVVCAARLAILFFAGDNCISMFASRGMGMSILFLSQCCTRAMEPFTMYTK